MRREVAILHHQPVPLESFDAVMVRNNPGRRLVVYVHRFGSPSGHVDDADHGRWYVLNRMTETLDSVDDPGMFLKLDDFAWDTTECRLAQPGEVVQVQYSNHPEVK